MKSVFDELYFYFLLNLNLENMHTFNFEISCAIINMPVPLIAQEILDVLLLMVENVIGY